jgi:hypothetical protein
VSLLGRVVIGCSTLLGLAGCAAAEPPQRPPPARVRAAPSLEAPAEPSPSTSAPPAEPLVTPEDVTRLERELGHVLDEGEPAEKRAERAARLRALLARPATRAAKIAWIELLDDRYVTAVPTEMFAEVIGPLLGDADETVAARAAQAAGYLDARYRVGLTARFEAALSSLAGRVEDAQLLGEILQGMGASGREAFHVAIEGRLGHRSPVVRSVAVGELCRASARRCVAGALRLFDDPDPTVRRSAVLAAAQRSLPSAELAARFADKLGDADRNVRFAALAALEHLGTRAEAPRIEALGRDADAELAARARATLAAVRKRK